MFGWFKRKPVEALEWKISKLEVKAGDVVLLKIGRHLCEEQHHELKAMFCDRLVNRFPDVTFLVFSGDPGDVDISVIERRAA